MEPQLPASIAVAGPAEDGAAKMRALIALDMRRWLCIPWVMG